MASDHTGFPTVGFKAQPIARPGFLGCGPQQQGCNSQNGIGQQWILCRKHPTSSHHSLKHPDLTVTPATTGPQRKVSLGRGVTSAHMFHSHPDSCREAEAPKPPGHWSHQTQCERGPWCRAMWAPTPQAWVGLPFPETHHQLEQTSLILFQSHFLNYIYNLKKILTT